MAVVVDSVEEVIRPPQKQKLLQEDAPAHPVPSTGNPWHMPLIFPVTVFLSKSCLRQLAYKGIQSAVAHMIEKGVGKDGNAAGFQNHLYRLYRGNLFTGDIAWAAVADIALKGFRHTVDTGSHPRHRVFHGISGTGCPYSGAVYPLSGSILPKAAESIQKQPGMGCGLLLCILEILFFLLGGKDSTLSCHLVVCQVLCILHYGA